MIPRILFVYQGPSPFILQDRDLLAKHAEIREFRWFDHLHPARALVKWMFRHWREYDLVFVWFGDTHATVAIRAAQLLRKPSIIVAGGYDVRDVPDGFLATRKGLRRAEGHFRRSTRIVTVSKALQDEVVRRFPGTATKTEVLYLGADVGLFQPKGPRKRQVLSVAGAEVWTRAWVKGWDRIAQVAQLLPDVHFLLIGASPEIARLVDPPANLEIRGPVRRADLVTHYQAAAVYLQASRFEALSSALMEAMSCGCVPVVTAVGGMPELVGDVGFVVGEDPEMLASAVQKALDSPERGVRARTRIVEQFSLARREEGLLHIVEDVLARSSS